MVPCRVIWFIAFCVTTAGLDTVPGPDATLACSPDGRIICCACGVCCGGAEAGARATGACFRDTLDTVGSWTIDGPWGKALRRAIVAPG